MGHGDHPGYCNFVVISPIHPVDYQSTASSLSNRFSLIIHADELNVGINYHHRFVPRFLAGRNMYGDRIKIKR